MLLENKTIAFVLNKNVLAGIKWFLGRILLASKFHLKYVIVSNDPKGSNFLKALLLVREKPEISKDRLLTNIVLTGIPIKFIRRVSTIGKERL